jgi:CheY-like chemotaxis protein
MAMSRQQTILVVDDQDVILEFMADLLLEAGYAVETATSGAMALKRIPEIVPDLLVTDFSMPEMDGWQLVQAIRQLPARQNLPIIVMSAGTRLPFDAANLDYQTAFLAKPFTIGALLELIERLSGA